MTKTHMVDVDPGLPGIDERKQFLYNKTRGSPDSWISLFCFKKHLSSLIFGFHHGSDPYRTMAHGPASPDGDVNRDAVLIGVSWALVSLAMIFVGLRIYCRVVLTRNMWWDDWAIIATLVRLSYPSEHKIIQIATDAKLFFRSGP